MRRQTNKINLRSLLINLGYILLASVIVTALVQLFSYAKSSKTDDDPVAYQKEINSQYAIYAPIVPDEVSFAGEKVPVENIDVREALDYEILKTMYWHSEAILYIKRANKYFPIIEPILKKHNIPDDFKYLAVAESGLRNVVSPANAAGYWQFLKETGKMYGLEVNKEIDERYNIEKSTEAACKYLQDAYNRYGNWTLAAASYNAGQGRINKRLKEQEVENYHDLLLNTETSRYVYRIVAYKLILQNPRNYGFVYRQQDLYQPMQTNTLEIDTTIADIVKFAQMHNTNYKVIKRLNPWLRKNTMPNSSGKTYYLKVPKQNGRLYKDSIN